LFAGIDAQQGIEGAEVDQAGGQGDNADVTPNRQIAQRSSRNESNANDNPQNFIDTAYVLFHDLNLSELWESD
jgi:hypothetical protein